MKCLIIGYGSIGEKYANILVDLGVNVYIHDLKKKLVLTKVNVIKNLHAIEQNFFSLIIICTPSQDHFETFQIERTSAWYFIGNPLGHRDKDLSTSLGCVDVTDAASDLCALSHSLDNQVGGLFLKRFLLSFSHETNLSQGRSPLTNFKTIAA